MSFSNRLIKWGNRRNCIYTQLQIENRLYNKMIKVLSDFNKTFNLWTKIKLSFIHVQFGWPVSLYCCYLHGFNSLQCSWSTNVNEIVVSIYYLNTDKFCISTIWIFQNFGNFLKLNKNDMYFKYLCLLKYFSLSFIINIRYFVRSLIIICIFKFQ